MTNDREKGSTASASIHAVIDRIEDNDIAVILIGDDERERIELHKKFLPAGASDGAHLRIAITLNERSRAAAQDKVRKLQDELESRSGTKAQKNFKL
jgi:hypothetical protein